MTRAKSPKVVASLDVEANVLVPAQRQRDLRDRSSIDLKTLLLAPEGRTDLVLKPRTSLRRRAPMQ